MSRPIGTASRADGAPRPRKVAICGTFPRSMKVKVKVKVKVSNYGKFG